MLFLGEKMPVPLWLRRWMTSSSLDGIRQAMNRVELFWDVCAINPNWPADCIGRNILNKTHKGHRHFVFTCKWHRTWKLWWKQRGALASRFLRKLKEIWPRHSEGRVNDDFATSRHRYHGSPENQQRPKTTKTQRVLKHKESFNTKKWLRAHGMSAQLKHWWKCFYYEVQGLLAYCNFRKRRANLENELPNQWEEKLKNGIKQ